MLLVTIDTFRADRLGVGVAPALDRLATSSVRFTNARSAVPLTLPSHATILTGLPPAVHGVRENGVDALPDNHPTIARLPKSASYQTAAFVGAFVLDRRFGLAQGFDTYDDRIARDPKASDRLDAERPASAVVDAALAWLQREGGSHQPFFVWIHVYDPHAPYSPPPEFASRAKSAYDGEIAYADSQIARVFDWLRSSGLDTRTLIIVAGDHGEGLGDHREGTHGMLLYDSTLRVPLIVSAPDGTAKNVADAVSLVDVAPTILHAAGVGTPVNMKGHDLLRPPTSPATSDPGVRDLYAETEYPRAAGWSPLQALTDGRWMAIRSGASTELYDLQSDPGEQHDVAATQTATAAAVAARIDAIRATATTKAPGTVSQETAERLRSLGYVASSATATSASGAPNPAAHIDAWNAFEDALAALNAKLPGDNRALPALEKLAAGNPGAPVFQSTYARALKDRGRLKDALAVYRDAARRWPTDAALMHDYAVAAREAGLRDEAARADQAAAAIAPDSAMAHNGLGLIAADANHLDVAQREFERATALDPTNASYWTNLGNARRGAGNAVAAREAYRRALDVDARTADAANGLGVLLVEANTPGDAIAWFERALDAAPDLVEARLNLGIALQQTGDAARARKAYRAVLAAADARPRDKDAAAKLLASLGASR
ncbi:MAG TPA: sulfatase-like hydrolase/transferase [Vicinamibacterales bacterium]|nr:sulfatase-like hydrolase/transferase [Vicinamibacterales bacterium]